MKRGAAALLVFSVALNVGLLSASFTHWWHDHREAADTTAGEIIERPAVAADSHSAPGLRDGRGFNRRRDPGSGDHAPRLRNWPGRRVQELTRLLDLSPDQRATMETSLLELRPQLVDLMGRMATARRDMAGLLAEPAVDRGRVRSRARVSAEIQAQLDEVVAEAMLREAAVLDARQRARYAELELNWKK